LQANRQLQRAIIVEGYMDVIALFQQDITYAVATLGTATTQHHLQRLLRHTAEIIFCFDGDTAGRTAAWRALQITLPIMRDDFQVRFMFLPEGEDPDSLVRKEGKTVFEKRMEEAMPLSQFFFQTLLVQADLSSMDGRARFVKLAQDQLKTLPPSIFQQMMLAEVAKKARIDAATLTPAAQQLRTRTSRFKPTKARAPSTLRLAITLLVQQPALGLELKEPLPTLTIRGFALFSQLIEIIQKNSIQTTGSLLEHWRDHKELPLLVKLAQTEHMIPREGIQNEFLGAIAHFKKLANKQLIEQLLHKSAQNALSPEEKAHLNALIGEK
jgi:DNA primase